MLHQTWRAAPQATGPWKAAHGPVAAASSRASPRPAILSAPTAAAPPSAPQRRLLPSTLTTPNLRPPIAITATPTASDTPSFPLNHCTPRSSPTMADPAKDKITTKLASIDPSRPFFSLEFFPPKTHQGRENLNARLGRMARALRPLFVTVTWGAGGSTAQRSLALAEVCQRQLGLTTCLHLTCTNMSRAILDDALAGAKEIGVRNILALRGDPPRKDEYDSEDTGEATSDSSSPPHPNGAGEDEEEFLYAVDLVKYIRKHHGDYFCIGVAAYPEGHTSGSYPDEQDPIKDLPFLVEKVQAGADFILTQLFYNVDAFITFEALLRNHPSGAFRDIPIIPGLMPIQSYQILKRTTKLTHASLPEEITKTLEPQQGDDEAVKALGVDILVNIIEKLKSIPSDPNDRSLRRGFHFYTLNLEKAMAFVLERSDLIPPDDAETTAAAFNLANESAIDGDTTVTLTTPTRRFSRRSSSIDPHNAVIVEDIRASLTCRPGQSLTNPTTTTAGPPITTPNTANPNPTNIAETLFVSEGEGSLGRAATWDDFPNGRFGDSRSPAFGDLDATINGYGGTTPLPLPATLARKHWSPPPTSPAHITALFLKHLSGDIPALPWSPDPLSPESAVITNELRRMTERGWWTIASQPAVDAVPSNHHIFGWGPTGGFVFQKAFVEFWCPLSDWEGLKARLDADAEISYYTGNAKGDVVSSLAGEEAVNAVTWGCFPGKEIVTPTIIETVAFKAWVEEAFALWRAWGGLYHPRGHSREARRFLEALAKGGEGWAEKVESEYLLVNIIHHGFKDPNGLWKVLGVAGQ
ncbi:methylenetetrahydrofolate reductase-domain-containing protein [Peziza echinospora]|nr:methylenetetrahydrofolate reductase-domain-containing protein [Peziza echinospora]